MRMLQRATLLALATGVVVLATAASALGSRAINIAPAGVITASGQVSFNGSSVCTLTLTGTLASSVSKASFGTLPGGRIGSITGVRAANCTGGVFTAVTALNLPWDVRADGFTGTLPAITRILVTELGTPIAITTAFGSCLYTGNMILLISEEQRTIRSGNLTRVSGSVLCPTTLSLAGTLAMSPRQTFTLV